MDYFTIFGIALGLSFDTFAASLTYGVIQNWIRFRQAVKLALIFAVFQGGMTVAGYFLGSIVSNELRTIDHWMALVLLCILGIRMIIGGLRKEGVNRVQDFSKTLTVFTLAIGTSIDALAVGISFALLNVRIWEAGTIIGMVTFLASMTAIRIGKSAGPGLGKNAEIIGGLILFAIGIRIFLEHTLGM